MSAPLLHNMSSRPRTLVEWQVEAPEPAMVRFRLAPVRRRLARAVGLAASSPHQLESALESLTPRLEEAWSAFAWQGAILLFPWREPLRQAALAEQRGDGPHCGAPAAPPLTAADPLLVVNVLGRTRSGLLLPGMPLSLEAAFLERDLATTDERLVRLAQASLPIRGGKR